MPGSLLTIASAALLLMAAGSQAQAEVAKLQTGLASSETQCNELQAKLAQAESEVARLQKPPARR